MQLGVPILVIVPNAYREKPHETGNRIDRCAASAVCRPNAGFSRQRGGARSSFPPNRGPRPRRQDALAGPGLPRMGRLLWLSPLGILRLRLLSTGLWLLLSAIPVLGWGLGLAPQTLASLVGSAKHNELAP